MQSPAAMDRALQTRLHALISELQRHESTSGPSQGTRQVTLALGFLHAAADMLDEVVPWQAPRART